MNYQQPQMQQQNNQLPFDPNNCMTQPMQFNQAPFIPNNISVDQALSTYVPAVATMLANEASSGCGKNPGRMFLFNQLSSNGYVNQDFVEVVQTAMDLLGLNVSQNGYNQNSSANLSEFVSKALILSNAANFQKFPALQQYVNAELFNDAVRIVNSIPGLRAEILQSKQRGSQMQQNNQFQQSANRFPQPMSNNSNFGGNSPGGFQPSRMQPGMQTGMQAGANHQVFNNRQLQQPESSQSTTNQVTQSGRYDNIHANNKASQSANTQVGSFNPNPQQSSMINQGSYFKPAVNQIQQPQAVAKALVWSPCEAQWHPATCDTRFQKIILKEIKWADDKMYVVTTAINLTEQEMEEAKHRIGFTERAMMDSTPERYGSRQEAIRDNVDAFVERNKKVREAITTEDDEIPAFSISNTARRSISANFLSPAIFEGRVMMKKQLQQTENDLSAYGVNAIISTPVLVDNDQETLLSQLHECSSFLRIQAVLKNALTNKNCTSVSKDLVAKIDNIFTREVNSILNNRLSLDDRIDSFITDAGDLITHLKNNHGEVFSKAYLSCQENFVNTYLNQVLVDEDMKDQMVDQLSLEITDEVADGKYKPGDNLPVSFITQFYTLTYLQVRSADLSVSKFGIVGTEVLLSKNPELFKLAKEMLDEEDTKVIPVAHRLLITSDNVIYEFHRGLINTDFITISKFH